MRLQKHELERRLDTLWRIHGEHPEELASKKVAMAANRLNLSIDGFRLFIRNGLKMLSIDDASKWFIYRDRSMQKSDIPVIASEYTNRPVRSNRAIPRTGKRFKRGIVVVTPQIEATPDITSMLEQMEMLSNIGVAAGEMKIVLEYLMGRVEQLSADNIALEEANKKLGDDLVNVTLSNASQEREIARLRAGESVKGASAKSLKSRFDKIYQK